MNCYRQSMNRNMTMMKMVVDHHVLDNCQQSKSTRNSQIILLNLFLNLSPGKSKVYIILLLPRYTMVCPCTFRCGISVTYRKIYFFNLFNLLLFYVGYSSSCKCESIFFSVIVGCVMMRWKMNYHFTRRECKNTIFSI